MGLRVFVSLSPTLFFSVPFPPLGDYRRSMTSQVKTTRIHRQTEILNHRVNHILTGRFTCLVAPVHLPLFHQLSKWFLLVHHVWCNHSDSVHGERHILIVWHSSRHWLPFEYSHSCSLIMAFNRPPAGGGCTPNVTSRFAVLIVWQE